MTKGGVMAVSYDMTNALRAQEHGHPPLVLVFESHGQDCRYKPLGEVCSTISQKYGTGGGNAPIVVQRNDSAGKQPEPCDRQGY